jgi:isopenicillin-N N-acyltransferase like protein
MTSTQHVRVEGSSYQRGRQYGVVLADHADYPHSICAHPDPAAHPCEQGATIASVLMDLTARRIWLAAGNPCQVPFEQLDMAL